MKKCLAFKGGGIMKKNNTIFDKILFIKLIRKISKISKLQFYSIYISFILTGLIYGIIIKIKQLIFDGAVSYTTGEKTIGYMFTILLSLLFCEILSIVISYGGNFLAENYDIKATSVLKQEVHMKINKLPNIYFEDNKLLDSIEKSYEGIPTAIAFINSLLDMVFMYLPTILVFAVYLFTIKPILILVLVNIFIPIVYAQFIKAKIHGKLEDEIAPLRRKCKYYTNAAVGRESFKETRVLGSFTYFKNLFIDVLNTMQKLRLKAEIKNNLYELSARLMSLLGYLGILYILFRLLIQKEISVGMFSAIFSSIDEMYILMEDAIVSRLGNYAMNYGKIKNYFNFMNLDEENKNGSCVISGNLSLENVTFSYPNSNTNALDNISLVLNEGEKIAIVGENGSGKTTLAKLLTGLYTPTSGSIKWNGHTTDEICFDDISQVFQNFQKYKMTLFDNIWISESNKETNNEKITESLKDAGITIDLETYPNGIETMLSKEFDGVDISGGQWQKMAIARGFYRDSKFVVLDEPTSAIDPVEEEAIYKRFQKLIINKTAVIITHRLGAVRFADKILVMNKGKVIGFGTHDYLLENNEEYKNMWFSQAEHYANK